MGEEYYRRETATVKYIHILVEGYAEEVFVRDALEPYLSPKGIFPSAKLVTTKRVKSGKNFKGGVTSYDRVKLDIEHLLQDRNAQLVTTMIDFYGLPPDFPDYANQPTGNLYQRVEFLEQAMSDDIRSHRFLPYLSIHEFEALLFVATEEIASAFPDSNKQSDLDAIKNRYANPEFINLEYPPAKRLEELYSQYQKTFHSPLIASQIGILDIRRQCPHFNHWLTNIETYLLGSNS